MNKVFPGATAVLGAFLFSSVAHSADPPSGLASSHTLSLSAGTKSPPAKIADVAWIEGNWTCEALGGTAQEYWQAPQGGAMLGSFRMIREGKPSFYEIATISENDGSLICRILHFDENLVGWEKERSGGPQTFPLVKLQGKTAYFNELTFEKKDDGTLDVWVVIHGKDGSSKEALFAYRPIATPSPAPAH